jgi:DNA-binding response OmpR family regulator
MEILIAEDDRHIAESLRKNFLDEGHHSVIARDGQEALRKVSEIEFDVILLDWRMPKLSGLEVCKSLRKEGIEAPIILITALTDVSNKVEALNLGADDYITKPFSFEEVMARVAATTRRYSTATRSMDFDSLSLDLLSRTVVSARGDRKLSEKEFDLLKYFLEHRGSIVSKEQLHEDVWHLPFAPGTNVVEVTVKNLRKKLEEAGGRTYIRTVYGEGYIFLEEAS